MIKEFKFYIGLLVLIAFLLPLNYYLNLEILNEEFSTVHYFSYTYYFIVVLIIHFIMKRALKRRPQRYVVSFMATMGIKIFLSLMILVVIMYSGIEKSKIFAINYLVLYLVFSAYSIGDMLRSQKAISEKAEKSL